MPEMAYKDPENTILLETTKGNVVIDSTLIWHPAMSSVSRNWHVKAPMMASYSIASSMVSWPRPAT
jgi:hypothetical protein